MRGLFYTQFCSPIATLWLLGDERGLLRLKIGGTEGDFLNEVELLYGSSPRASEEIFALPLRELESYFKGWGRVFTTPLVLKGTPFQLRVWNVVKAIPFGTVLSYKEVSRRAGSPRGARAVGMAMRANPLPIFIPCHRVVREDGTLGGFSAGEELKRWLLRLEGVGRWAD